MTTQANVGLIAQLVLADYLEVKFSDSLQCPGPRKWICGEKEGKSTKPEIDECHDFEHHQTDAARRIGSSPRTLLKRFTFFTFSVSGWMLDLPGTLS